MTSPPPPHNNHHYHTETRAQPLKEVGEAFVYRQIQVTFFLDSFAWIHLSLCILSISVSDARPWCICECSLLFSRFFFLVFTFFTYTIHQSVDITPYVGHNLANQESRKFSVFARRILFSYSCADRYYRK